MELFKTIINVLCIIFLSINFFVAFKEKSKVIISMLYGIWDSIVFSNSSNKIKIKNISKKYCN